MDEFILWRGKANLKIGVAKITGEMIVTDKKIKFRSISRKIEIGMDEIDGVVVKGIIKRIEISAGNKEYSFFTPKAKEVAKLIERFIS